MPKLKTNRSAAKRFRASSRGQIKRRAANRNHILTKKKMKRKRHLRAGALVHESDLHSIRRMLLIK